MNSFIKAIKELNLPKIVAMIQKNPEWIAYKEEGGRNALHYLGGVKVGDDLQKAEISLEIVQLLLKKGMDINSVHEIIDEGCDPFPATPLWYAYAKGRNRELYTWLLNAGARPDNCMFAIAWNDDAEAAELFKAKGAKITDNSGLDTPFLSAIYWKRFRVAEWFLNNGADVNIEDEQGMTALLYAVKKKYDIEQIQFLLDHGADVNLKNKAGLSAKEMAETNRQRKILGIFNKS